MTGRILRDVVFAERIGFRPLTLDLHLPDGDPTAVALFVHGGGWRLGSRRTFVPGLAEDASFGRITDAGLAVVSIDYRLSGEARFPAPVEDVLAAARWIGERGAEHGLGGHDVVAWGESSGAHLALLAAFAPGSGIAGVVDWYGPADLTRLGHDLHPDDPDRFDADPGTREAGLLGGAVGERRDAAEAASPALVVPADPPPVQILHGEADDLIPIAQSERLAAALRRVDGPVELVRVPGASHFWRGAADVGPLFDRSIAFVSRIAGRHARESVRGPEGNR